MRLRLLALCAGIAAHSRMRSIPSWFDWLPANALLFERAPANPQAIELFCTAAAMMLALALATVLSASIRRSVLALDPIPDPACQLTTTRRLAPFIKHSGCLCMLFACGFFWAMLMAQMQLAQRFPTQLEGVDFWLIGHVEGLVRGDQTQSPTSTQARSRRSQQFEFRVERSCFRLLPEQCEGAAQSAVLAGQKVSLNDYSQLALQSGERWLLRVRVNRPHGFSNPGGYDFEAGQFQRAIMARGYIRETAFNTRLQAENRLLSHINISRLRAAVAADIDHIFASQAHAESGSTANNSGLLKALVIGDREGISTQQWDLFTATGTNHLVVISGLHVGFVSLCAWTLMNWISRRFTNLLLRIPAQHLAALAAIFAAACYSMLAGFSLPTQRALIMIVVLMASRLSGRSVAPGDSLTLAALLVLIKDPLAVTQAGFWLSFAAVASLFFALIGYGRPDSAPSASSAAGWSVSVFRGLWQRWLQPQWAVSVGLLLPLLLWTGQMSLNAPVANVFAIPLVSLLVVPMALTGSLLLSLDTPVTVVLATYLLQFADLLLDWLQMFLMGLTTLTPGLWRPLAPSLSAMVLMAISSVLLLMPRAVVPRWLALMLLLPLIWPAPAARPPPGRVWLQFLDVGQGLAVVVHTHKHHLLFDTGPALGPDFDAGQAVIMPYLRQAHVSQLDSLIISHWHADHSGGLSSVVNEVDVRQKLAGMSAGIASAGFDLCQAGQHWRWDDVSFSVLFPTAVTANERTPDVGAANINNSSCVLLIEAGGQRALLTGDIEAPAERWLVREHGDNLRVDILQAPHHGSRSSSIPAFVQATRAKWVVMSAGYRNRFNHPHTDVVERYNNVGSEVLLSTHNGAIWIELGGVQAQILSRYREQQRRFWFNL